MRQKSGPVREPAEQVVKDIRRATRRHFSAEDKIRIVLEGLLAPSYTNVLSGLCGCRPGRLRRPVAHDSSRALSSVARENAEAVSTIRYRLMVRAVRIPPCRRAQILRLQQKPR
jgi:hypothetical protein